MTRWMLVIFLLCVGLAAPASSQALSDAPRPPVSGVMDESGFFSRDSGTLKRITDVIRDLEANHGFKIYVVVEPVLIAANAPERAIELQNAWLPEGDGLVVVFESNSGRLGIGRDMGAIPGKETKTVRVPSHETNAILNHAVVSLDTNAKLTPEIYVDHLVANLATGFDSYFKSLKTPAPPDRKIKIGMVALGLGSALALGALLLGSLIRHSGASGATRFRFPTVDTPERLGAPCGASVTTRKFTLPNA